MIPQLLYIMLCILGLGVHMANHGEERVKNYNGWTQLISIIIIWVLLYYGGFWDGLI